MTVQLRFFGHSDDQAEFEASDGREEETPVDEHGQCAFLVTHERDVVVVLVRYEDNACWSATALPKSEDHPLPDWPMRVQQSKTTPYSAELVIDAPDGAKVQCGVML